MLIFNFQMNCTKVSYLLKGILCSDVGLQVAMANIKVNTAPNGKRNNFEVPAAHLLLYDLVAKKRAQSNKHNISSISDVHAQIDISTVEKPGIGKMGVHFHFTNMKNTKNSPKNKKLATKTLVGQQF